MRAFDRGIPRGLLDKARCVVVIPGMKKAGFILGAKYGRGFAVCRHDGSGWSAPAAMRVEGGSIGFQIGASDTDVVLLVMNDGGMRHLLSDKFTIRGGGNRCGGSGWPRCERANRRYDDRGNVVLFSLAWYLRRDLAGRRNAPSRR
jgi:lipid-binding SYLF domain-containing protein